MSGPIEAGTAWWQDFVTALRARAAKLAVARVTPTRVTARTGIAH